MAKERNYHFDNVKALLIFLVVFGHVIEPLQSIPIFKNTYFIIYSFHMPLFIFIAGYFARASTKGLKKLLLLFIKYEIIYSIVYALLFGLSSGGNQPGSVFDALLYALQPIWVLWFLISLISWRLLLIAYEKHPLAIVIIVGLIIGFNFIPFNFRVLSLGRTLSFFPYFLLGYLANKHQFNMERIHRNRTISFYLTILVVSFWVLFSGQVTESLLYGATSFSSFNYSLFELILFKINTYLVAAAVSVIVLNIIPTHETRFSEIGPKTLPIYLWHPIIIWILVRINFFNQIRDFSAIPAFIILLLLSYFITLFLKDRKV